MTPALSAVLRILQPTTAAPAVQGAFYWNAVTGTTRPANFQCGPSTPGRSAASPRSTGNGGIFNGRWLRICFQLEDNYSAPSPSLSPAGLVADQLPDGRQPGASTDLTTWEVNVRGNPVHLVLP